MPRKFAPTCSIDGCERRHYSRGWCKEHYRRWWKHGDPSLGGLPRPKAGEPMRWLLEVALSHDADECLIWPFRKIGKGYGGLAVDGKTLYAHRLVCESAHGPAPSSSHHAAHSCGQGHLGCVAPMHLRWSTPRENAADKVSHGTALRGTKIPWSRLSEDDVRQIRDLESVLSRPEIARAFGVSVGAIAGIHKNQNWAWLK